MRHGPREKIHLTGPEELLLGTLFMRAEDAKYSNPVLGDQYAQGLIERCNINTGESHYPTDPRWVRAIACRAKQLDDWCQEFLDRHGDKPVTVLHLACGLDSRYWRVRKGPNVRWYDIDQPLVVDLRSRLIPNPGPNYTLRTLQITKPGWTRDIPNDKPTLIIAEGLFMYLDIEDSKRAIFRELCDNFPEDGEIVFDTLCSLSQMLSSWIPFMRSSGSVVRWGTDDPRREVEEMHPRLRMVEQKRRAEYNGTNPPIYGEWLTWVATWLPSYKWDVCVNRFKF